MQHFVKYAPHSINIALEVHRPYSLEPLGSQVKRRAQKGVSVVVLAAELLG
jgi:hypothetical protein